MHALRSLAKLNLYLHITGKRDDGYHLLDSMAMFAEDLYDEILIEESSKNKVETLGKYGKNVGPENILSKVLQKFSEIKTIPEFHIRITKNIPVGAGLGGGSGNAAALLRYLIERFYPEIEHQDLMDLCVQIGADVPPCYYSEKLYFRGIGEKITLIKDVPPIYAIILFPEIHLSTKEIFSRQGNGFTPLTNQKLSFNSHQELWGFLNSTQNDLLDNVEHLYPELIKILKNFEGLNHCKIARMTGSGSACFGLFESHKDAISGANSLQKIFSSYSIYVTKLR